MNIAGDWWAEWIAPKSAEAEKNFYFRARRAFIIDTLPKTAPTRVAAESYYILYVNGVEAGRGPARGTHTINYYDAYDVSNLLREGENVVAVLVCCMNMETFMAAPSQPGLILEIDDIVKTDGSWQVLKTDEWKREVQTYTAQTGFCEWRDTRHEPLGWTLGNDDASWETAIALSRDSGPARKKLLPSGIPRSREIVYYPTDVPVKVAVPELQDPEDIMIAKILTIEEHSPLPETSAIGWGALAAAGEKSVGLAAPANNGGIAFILDFAREIIGGFELEISAPSGTIVDISHEEALWQGRLRADHVPKSYNFADRYVLRGGRQKIGNTLVERGFRMVQVTVRSFSSGLVTIHDARAVDRRYPFVERAAFNSSDSLLNRIWDICRETLSACSTDVFTDCPWRERAFWVNDLIVENRTCLQAFGDPRIHKRAFEMVFSDRFDNGLIPGVCPCPREGQHLLLLPPNLYITLMLKDYYLYTGDNVPLREHLPAIIGILEKFASWQGPDGLIVPPIAHWNFFDWSYGYRGLSFNGKKTPMLNYFYVIALKTTLELAEATGVDLDRDKYLKAIETVSKQTWAMFFKDNEKRLADALENGKPTETSSQVSHALALIAGERDAEKTRYLEDALIDEKLLCPELYFHFFIFQAMKLTGQENEILKRIRKYWGDIAKSGSPTVWESGVHQFGKQAFNGAASLCHGFATAPIDFFQTVILGVTPLKPGFAEFLCDPHAFDLEFAEGAVPTPNGNIEVKWRKANGKLAVSLKVPSGLAAVSKNSGRFFAGSHEFEISPE